MKNFTRMFKSSTGYFSSIKCPKLDHCKLPNCIFSHGSKRPVSTESSKLEGAATKKLKVSNAVNDAAGNIINPVAGRDLTMWTPKTLPGVGAPASIQQRIKYINALIAAYQKHNIPLPKTKAVEQEYNIAVNSTKTTYGANIKILIKNASNNTTPASKVEKRKLSPSESYEAVKKLIHPIHVLERNQYVTKIPTEYVEKIDDRNKRKCDHCSEQFYITQIDDKVECLYHDRKKRYIVNGSERSAEWECCSEVVGVSQGCKTATGHVFKASDPYDLHQLIPFRETPKATKVKQQIIGMDCEMGYTTKGMEVIRVTIMDFFTSSVLFDEIVKPFGKVIDLNTKWSGVDEIPQTAMTLDNVFDVILGTIIDGNTIIIGHGLENDLNVLRLIHHKVVDTAILYPKSLTKKFSLKDLSFQYLDRKIQTGEHSSEEDSLAAMDIVKYHICT